jgi:hypothetical protein
MRQGRVSAKEKKKRWKHQAAASCHRIWRHYPPHAIMTREVKGVARSRGATMLGDFSSAHEYFDGMRPKQIFVTILILAQILSAPSNQGSSILLHRN